MAATSSVLAIHVCLPPFSYIVLKASYTLTYLRYTLYVYSVSPCCSRWAYLTYGAKYFEPVMEHIRASAPGSRHGRRATIP